MRTPDYERVHEYFAGGFQRIYHFANGYGASVVNGYGAYVSGPDQWEIAVLRRTGDGIMDYDITYDTDITDDVIGHQSEDEIDVLLSRIEALPQNDWRSI